jgi:putative ABC transport system substrate-binding protein
VIDRRAFLATTALAALAAPRLGETRAVDGPRVPRVGVLGETNPVPWMVTTPVVDIECRWADLERTSLPDLAAALVASDVDAIVAVGPAAAHAVARSTARVPIVAVVDDDEAAAVRTLARSAGNVSYLLAPSESRMARQRLRLLASLVPHTTRVAVLFNPDTGLNTRAVARLPAGVLALPARTVDDIERAALTAVREAAGLLVLADTLFAVHASRLVELAREARLPAVYGARTFVNAGGFVALYGDMGDTIRRTATVVSELLAGVPPRAVVPPPAPRPQIALNLATAGRLGVEIPPSLLAQALVTTG